MSFLTQSITKLLGHTSYINSLEQNIETYLELLQKWNKAYNLTAINDKEEMLKLHILDSLAILPFIQGKRIIDVGTGAGLPGIIIAMANPNLTVTLLDSNGKKIRFLQEVKRVLAISNINIIQSRVLDYHPDINFDTVISRAFSSIKNMQEWSQHLLTTNGILLAMKGRSPDEELSVITSPYQVHTYQVPGVVGERCCVILHK